MALAESSIQLVPDATLIIHLVLVLVMVYVLNRTLLGPMNRVLADRERRTTGTLNEAKSILEQADEKTRSWEQALREARKSGYGLLEKERAIAVREREANLAVVKEELAKDLETEKTRIRKEAAAARGALESEATQLARTIGSKILGRVI